MLSLVSRKTPIKVQRESTGTRAGAVVRSYGEIRTHENLRGNINREK